MILQEVMEEEREMRVGVYYPVLGAILKEDGPLLGKIKQIKEGVKAQEELAAI